MKVPLDSIKLGAGTQPRAKIDEATVADYAEAMRDGATFPPVIVYYDGETYYLADGFHRVDAAYKLGADDIEAEVRQGTREDAIDYACSAAPNSKHGLRETPEDRHRRVETMLRMHSPAWSNRRIAEHCGVAEGTVRNAKDRCADYAPDRVMGRDGKEYPAHQAPRPEPVEPPEPEDEEEPAEEPEPYTPEPEAEPDKSDLVKLQRRHAVYESLTWYFASLHGDEKEREKTAIREWLEEETATGPEPAPYVPADEAADDIMFAIRVKLSELADDPARHSVVNEVIKRLRAISIQYNREAGEAEA